jgi:lipoate-protein ligase A
MAADWWLLENAEFPSFRHYKWKSMETSFGYGQDWEWVEKVTSLSIHELIRRPTGGGIVKHGMDWTYCLVIPRAHKSFTISPLDFYKYVHQSIGNALSEQNIATNLQPCPTVKGKVIPGDCFEEPVGWDLMDNNTNVKIAGAAMKRTRKGLLLQGTIFADNSWNLDSELFYNSLVVFFAEMLGEKEERVVWIESFEEEQKKISKQFTELSWKKSRKRN